MHIDNCIGAQNRHAHNQHFSITFINEQEEPTASSKRIGQIWETTDGSSRVRGNHLTFRKGF